MNFGKVTGERIGAAIIDSIIVGIIVVTLATIYMFMTMDVNAFIEMVNETNGMLDPDIINELAADLVVPTELIGLVIGVFFFVLIPFKWNGQTLGKKMLKIKAINEIGGNPNIWQHFLRAIQVWGSYTSTVLMIFLLIDFDVYNVIAGSVGNLVNIIVFVSFILILVQQDGRGIHDMLAKTYVVKDAPLYTTQYQPSQFEETQKSSDWVEEIKEEEEKDDWGF